MRDDRVYVSDRGTTFYVCEMETSHIINALGHHEKQKMTLNRVFIKHPDDENIAGWLKLIGDICNILEEELRSRSPGQWRRPRNEGRYGTGESQYSL